MPDTNSQHTPGPWTIGHRTAYGYGIDATGDVKTGICYGANIEDARLIAAAPDLLAALKAILQGAHDVEIGARSDSVSYQIHGPLMNAARDAIAKAEAAR